MAYNVYTRAGHHRVDMSGRKYVGLNIQLDPEAVARIREQMSNIGEAFHNIGLQMHHATRFNAGYTIQVKDGHHRVIMRQPATPSFHPNCKCEVDPDFTAGVNEFMDRYDGTMRALAKMSEGGEVDVEGTGGNGQARGPTDPSA